MSLLPPQGLPPKTDLVAIDVAVRGLGGAVPVIPVIRLFVFFPQKMPSKELDLWT